MPTLIARIGIREHLIVRDVTVVFNTPRGKGRADLLTLTFHVSHFHTHQFDGVPQSLPARLIRVRG